MKIEKISYQKTFSIGPYLTDKVGIEASVDAGETPELVLTTLKAIAEEWHTASNKSLYGDQMVNHDLEVSQHNEIDSEFDNLHKLLANIEYQEDALNLIKKSSFKFHTELNAIAKSKPNKK